MQIARIYDDPPGPRYLIDRLWPRGVSKERANLAGWLKDWTPSDGLRKGVHAGDISWDLFRTLYLEELQGLEKPDLPSDAVLVTAAKNPQESHCPVFLEWLQE